MSETLKPCPFCGGKARLMTHWVYCENCSANVQVGVKSSEHESIIDSIRAWNRRVKPDSKSDMIEKGVIK